MSAEKCQHGWTEPPECPQCVAEDRDDLDRDMKYFESHLMRKGDHSTPEAVDRIKCEINDLRQKLDAANKDAQSAIASLNEVSKFSTEAITKITQECDAALASCAAKDEALREYLAAHDSTGPCKCRTCEQARKALSPDFMTGESTNAN